MNNRQILEGLLEDLESDAARYEAAGDQDAADRCDLNAVYISYVLEQDVITDEYVKLCKARIEGKH